VCVCVCVCVLQRAADTVRAHIQLTQSEGFCFGAKIVRGAYMDEASNTVCTSGSVHSGRTELS